MARAQAGGVDVLVNDPALDTPEYTTQSETTLAVLGDTVCAAYVDTSDGSTSGFSRSGDRGRTWEDRGETQLMSDPVLAVHRASGVFYLAMNSALEFFSAIGIARSVDDCRTFSDFTVASSGSGAPLHLQDKPWIAVDNSGGERDGHVYVCWTRFVDGLLGNSRSGEIRFSRSTDGGATFVGDQIISGAEESFPFGCSIDVGPKGELYVAWVNRDAGAGRPVLFRRSLDGGQSWQERVQVNTRPLRHAGLDRQVLCEPNQIRRTLNGDIRQLPQVWIAVDTTGGPFAGDIHVAWADDPLGGMDNGDVVVTSSRDGGTTWLAEMQLGGDSETDQFEPFLRVGGQGTLSVAWYDRRNDPLENLLIDVYASFSRDGGRVFDPIDRITDVSFPVPPITGQPSFTGNFDPGRSACYMGEYIALAADAESFFYAWGDNRNTVISDTYPAGRPDPDVFFDRREIPRILHPADANCDGRVTAADLPAVTRLVAAAELGVCTAGDADRSGSVDAGDFAGAISAAFFEETPRTCVVQGDASCRGGEICETARGTCEQSPRAGICISSPTACLEIARPVCGCDGVTYDNDCLRQMTGVGLAHEGVC